MAKHKKNNSCTEYITLQDTTRKTEPLTNEYRNAITTIFLGNQHVKPSEAWKLFSAKYNRPINNEDANRYPSKTKVKQLISTMKFAPKHNSKLPQLVPTLM